MRKLLIKQKILCFSVKALVCFVAFLSLPTVGVVAQSLDSLDRLFTIREIKVDERASRASEARRTALSKAEQEAFDILLRKITQPEGREILPELSVQEKQALISGIEVVEEQASSRRYTATLNVRFEPSSVSQFLARHGVPHVLSTGRGIVALHAHRDGLNEFLWQPNPATFAARNEVDWVNRIRQYVFPRGEIRERLAVTHREVAALEAAGKKDIADFHSVQSILMISSIWDIDGDGGTLRYRFSSTDGGGAVAREIQAQGADAQAIALAQMFEVVLEQIDTSWRDQLLVDTGTGGEMEALIPTIDISVLTNIEKRLADVTLVRNFKILSVGLPFSTISFQYTGREDQLVLALRFAGLSLDMYGDEKLLKLRSPRG